MSVLTHVVEEDSTTNNLKVVRLPDGCYMARFRVMSPKTSGSSAPHVYGFGPTRAAAEADALEWFGWRD
jgi:hypothetical protein